MTLAFLAAFILSFVATGLWGRLAFRLGLVDRPGDGRKIHPVPKPLSGGIAIFFALAIVVFVFLRTGETLTGGEITPWHYLGVFLGGLILMIGGFLDDRFDLPPHVSVLAPILAAVVAIGFGIEVEKLTNHFSAIGGSAFGGGGFIYLASWQSDLLVFVWLMAVMYTTKFLDGLDGLATGISAIGALMVMLLSLTAAYFQPDVALLSAVSLGALLGFLVWNFHPAGVFLGEGGSTFVGFLLGILAVISGGKLATALLVLGVPLLDVLWVILRRWREGGVRRIFRADRKHLHHRLLDIGWGQRRIVLLYYFLAAGFGVAALFLQSRDKLLALIILTLMVLLAAAVLVLREKHGPKSA